MKSWEEEVGVPIAAGTALTPKEFSNFRNTHIDKTQDSTDNKQERSETHRATHSAVHKKAGPLSKMPAQQHRYIQVSEGNILPLGYKRNT